MTIARHRFIAACLLVCAVVAGRASAQAYELIYNPGTGNVTINTLQPGNTIQSIRLNSSTNQLKPAKLRHVLPNQFGFTPSVAQIWINAPSPVTPASAVLLDPTTANNINGTAWNMGDILPTGLDEAGLDSVLTTSTYGQFSTTPSPSFTRVVVPEPASVTLLSFAGLCLARRRRRVA